MLEFYGHAISLSGLTGTFLKSGFLNSYYRFWWSITSGGPAKGNRLRTAIIDLNAGTGEVYIKDLNETIFGSAGHALQLKSDLDKNNSLKIILIEEDPTCYFHLKEVIKSRFPGYPISDIEGKFDNVSNVYIFNCNLDQALENIQKIKGLGTAIFFFDPLRMVHRRTIEKVASNRIRTHFSPGTEFIIFLFTSDYFLGRNEFVPLPSQNIPTEWTLDEQKSVIEADTLFGHDRWRADILNKSETIERERKFVELYTSNMKKWFRFVLALPFNPKDDQLYHLIYCSNYEIGIRAVRSAFRNISQQEKYDPDNSKTYRRFLYLHPNSAESLKKNKRPLTWLLLWTMIKQEDGIFDLTCEGFRKHEKNIFKIEKSLEWLNENGYIEENNSSCAWDTKIRKYSINWPEISKQLGISAPPPLNPPSTESATLVVEKRSSQSTLF